MGQAAEYLGCVTSQRRAGGVRLMYFMSIHGFEEECREFFYELSFRSQKASKRGASVEPLGLLQIKPSIYRPFITV